MSKKLLMEFYHTIKDKMQTITIHPPIEIFDDPEFCNEKKDGCEKLFRGQCQQFFKNLDYDWVDLGYNRHTKCDECKKYWKLTKDRQNIVNDIGQSLTQDQANGIIENS